MKTNLLRSKRVINRGYLFDMKFIIGESRLRDLVMSYLDQEFDGLEHRHLPGHAYHWWAIGNDCMIDMSDDEGFVKVGVYEPIWKGLNGLFNLTIEETNQYIATWIEWNLEIYPEEIYTFYDEM